MYRDKRIAVVVPAYNEETNILRVTGSVPDYVDFIIVVDDCSLDATAARVEEAAKKDERIILLRHRLNQGVGGAIATGYEWARDNNLDIAVVMAGDGQMNPDEMPNLLDPVVTGEVDYSKANRLVSGQAFRQIPKVRYFGNSVLSLLTKIASGYWHVADSQTGYTAINSVALQAIPWQTMYKRYGQPNDLLVKLNVHGFRVKDIPQEPVYNVGEVSKLRVRKVLFPISGLLLKSFLWRLKEKYIIRDFHPLIFFYLLGFGLLGASGLLFIRLIYLWIQLGHAPELTALAWMMSFATGLQSVFFAMWFDMEYNRRERD